MKLQIELTCRFCKKKYEIAIEVEGWSEATIFSSESMCPEHAAIAEFAKAQCYDCVYGWGECPLWNGFYYMRNSHNTAARLAEDELKAIESGVCPRRLNGRLHRQGDKYIDASPPNPAPVACGRIFVQAIREYWKKYPNCAR